MEDYFKEHPDEKSKKTYLKTNLSLGLAKHLHQQSHSLEDQQLWEQFKFGNERAFTKIFLKYHPVLFHLGLTMSMPKLWIEDTIQDLFIDLWQKRMNLGNVESVKYYLIVSFRRRLLRLKESHQRMCQLLERVRYEHPVFETSFDKLMIQVENDRELNSKIARFIEKLPSSQKLAIQYRYFDEKSYDEIGSIMNINARSARKFVYKAIKALRNELK